MNVIPFRTRKNKQKAPPNQFIIYVNPDAPEEIKIEGRTVIITTYCFSNIEALRKKAVALYQHKSKEVQGV